MIYLYIFLIYVVLGDGMSELLVRLDGSVEEILQRLLKAGFFKTKAEAVRAGLIELGNKYRTIKSNEEYLDELAVAKLERIDEEIKKGKRKVYTEEEVRKKYGF